MLASLKEVLGDAKKRKYGVGMFNAVSLEMARGIIEAAEETKSPVIIATAEVLLPYTPLEELSYFLVPMAKKASVPVVVHYDHGMTQEKVVQAMVLGHNSVMYDGSMKDYEQNVAECAEMTRIARMFGACIEAELGHVGQNENSAEAVGGESIYTEPDVAKDYVDRTGVDALAVAIGTAHGAYKSTPKLDIERLKQIAETVDVPLVLHGGSGLSDDDFRNCIKNGIAKVNIFTDINVAAAKGAAEAYQEGLGMSDMVLKIVDAVKQETIKKMKIFDSCNKA